MKYLFVTGPVPDEPRYNNPGFSRSGNLAVRGIAEGLNVASDGHLTVISHQAIRVFPRVRQLWLRGAMLTFPSGITSTLIGGVNLPYLRGLFRGVVTFCFILLWAWRNRHEERCVVSYNFRTPPFWAVLPATKLTRSKIVPIVMDISMSPGQMNPLKNALDWMENTLVKAWAPAFDGVAVITEAMGKRYFPENKTILIDGGLSPDIVNRLFPLKRDGGAEPNVVTFVMAGLLNHMNGVDLVLEAMKLNKNPNIRLVMAGLDSSGNLPSLINGDARITYVGMLNLDELFTWYRKADVLMNIRLTKTMDSSVWFPSKALESMGCGRLLLSTNVAHIKKEYGDYCYIIEDETPEALSSTMNKLSAMPRKERDSMGSRARQFIIEHHTWEQQMKQFVEFCATL